MNRKIKQVRATFSHCAELAFKLADADVAEIKQHGFEGSHDDMAVRLWQNCKASDQAYAIVNATSGVVYAIGGYGAGGCVWFLCSVYVSTFNKEERKAFREQLEANRDMALRVYPVLFNYIWKGNKRHIGFTRSCGARFMATAETDPFIRFEFHKKDFPHLDKY